MPRAGRVRWRNGTAPVGDSTATVENREIHRRIASAVSTLQSECDDYFPAEESLRGLIDATDDCSQCAQDLVVLRGAVRSCISCLESDSTSQKRARGKLRKAVGKLSFLPAEREWHGVAPNGYRVGSKFDQQQGQGGTVSCGRSGYPIIHCARRVVSSEAIVDEACKEPLAELFRTLDHYRDGFVSAPMLYPVAIASGYKDGYQHWIDRFYVVLEVYDISTFAPRGLSPANLKRLLNDTGRPAKAFKDPWTGSASVLQALVDRTRRYG